jgi:hypothetical protein
MYWCLVVANCPVPIFLPVLPLSRFFLCPAIVLNLAAKDQTLSQLLRFSHAIYDLATFLPTQQYVAGKMDGLPKVGVVALNLREFHVRKLVSLFPDSATMVSSPYLLQNKHQCPALTQCSSQYY